VFESNNDDYFILKNVDELDYDFEDTVFKSTIKKIKTTKERDVIVSINRFTDEILEKFRSEKIGVRDQFLLSQTRHET